MTKIISKIKDFISVDKNLVFLELYSVFSFIIFFQNRTINFNHYSLHNYLTSHALTLANNLSFNNNLLLYNFKHINPDGTVFFDSYTRFPITIFALLKPITLLFPNDVANQVYLSRLIMCIFFYGAIFICFKLFKAMTKSRFQSIVITFISFSSFYVLNYYDMVFNDTPSLFGTMLSFYSIFKLKNGDKKRYYLFAFVSALFGWQSLTVYISWNLVELYNILSIPESRNLRSIIGKIKTTKSFRVLVLTLSTSITFLTFQLITEWRTLGSNFSQLPFIERLLFQFGPESFKEVSWNAYLRKEIQYLNKITFPHYKQLFFAILAISLPFISSKISFKKSSLKNFHKNEYLPILILSGILWHLIMRYFSFVHEFQAIFYIGIPLTIYYSFTRLLSKNSFKSLSIIVIIFFCISIIFINHDKSDHPELAQAKSNQNEYSIIARELPNNSKLYIQDNFYFTRTLLHVPSLYFSNVDFTTPQQAEYIVSNTNIFNAKKLTNNDRANLWQINKRDKTNKYLNEIPRISEHSNSQIFFNNSGNNPYLQINETIFLYGMEMSVGSDVKFKLDKKFTKFSSHIGINSTNTCKYNNDLRFIIKGDGKIIYESNTLQSNISNEKIYVDLTNINILELNVTSSQKHLQCQRAVLGNAYLK